MLAGPAEKGRLDRAPGLERFLPPVGKEAAALSDTEIIERYFQQVLARSSDRYPWFLSEYARALEGMGKVDAAEGQDREGIARLRSEVQWQERGMRDFLSGAYAAFLCRQGRAQEAREFSGGSPCPPATPPENGGEGRTRPWVASRRVVFSEERQEAKAPDSLQPLSSLYIIEVPEKAPES